MTLIDAGPAPQRSPLTIHVVCEVCGEHLLVALPPRGTRYGALDCPACGSSYVVRPTARRSGRADEGSPPARDAFVA